jgi:hypothetical protein
MRYFQYILLLLVVILVGCNKETPVETSSEARVNTFTFYRDTLNLGLTDVTYKIDHSGDTGRIYCNDSLRFGTRLDSVVPYVTYKATPGSATFHLPDTTIASTGADTMNFCQSPIYLQVISSDLTTEQWYKFDINVHQANPDLYVWKRLTERIFPPQSCETKAFFVHGSLSLLVNNGLSTSLYQSSDGTRWTRTASQIPSLPVPCRVREIIQHNDTLYYLEDGFLYRSTDMLTWTKTDFSHAATRPITMLLSYHNHPWCVAQDTANQQLLLATIQADNINPQTLIAGTTNGYLPSTFPIGEFAALSFDSSSERPRAMIVGGHTADGQVVNDRWSLEYVAESGYRLKNFSISQPTFESLTGISIIQYDNHLMMFGGINNDLTWRSDILYSDDEGMNWYVPDTANNQLPSTYTAERYNQSVLVDTLDNIYIIGGQSNTQSFSDVYRGFLNSAKWK